MDIYYCILQVEAFSNPHLVCKSHKSYRVLWNNVHFIKLWLPSIHESYKSNLNRDFLKVNDLYTIPPFENKLQIGQCSFQNTLGTSFPMNVILENDEYDVQHIRLFQLIWSVYDSFRMDHENNLKWRVNVFQHVLRY